jgi:hypothetical protein
MHYTTIEVVCPIQQKYDMCDLRRRVCCIKIHLIEVTYDDVRWIQLPIEYSDRILYMLMNFHAAGLQQLTEKNPPNLGVT